MPFNWILNEAEKAGLLVDKQRLRTVLDHPPPSAAPWDDPQHESLTLLWWPAELFPKIRRRPGSWPRPRLGLGRHREVHAGAPIDWSALLRIRETSYSPPNLNSEFLNKVRNLEQVPDSMPYQDR
jgi:hypothetical protein